MRVVHDHREGLPGLHRLEATGRALRVRERIGGSLHGDADGIARRDRRQCVLDVEVAGERRPHVDLTIRPGAEKPRARSVEGHLEGAVVGVVGARRREGSKRRGAGVAQLAREARAVRIVHVDDGPRGGPLPSPWHEQPALGPEVVLHVRVEVQVVLGQVREHSRGEADAVAPVLGERVRGNLHRACLVTRVEHPAEGPLEVDRLGGRSLDLLLLPAHDALDGTQEPRPGALGLENVANQKGRRGLPVRASDSDDPKRSRRILPEANRDRRHRGAGVGNRHLGHRQVQMTLDHQRRGAPLDGRGGEIVAVGPLPLHAEEEPAGLHPARVIGEGRDVSVRVPRDAGQFGAGEQLPELHRGILCGDFVAAAACVVRRRSRRNCLVVWTSGAVALVRRDVEIR